MNTNNFRAAECSHKGEQNLRVNIMNKARQAKLGFPLAISMAFLGACGGSGDDPDPQNVPVQVSTTNAQISGNVVKGTMQGAQMSVESLNGSKLNLQEASTDNDGEVTLSFSGEPGFGINSILKLTALADANSGMICDAVDCGGVAMGGTVRGTAIAGTELSTLTYLSVSYGNSAGSDDGTFHISGLTTLATALIEQEIAEGRNVTTQQLLDLAQQEASISLLKAFGSNLNVNVFKQTIVSAESRDNFVASTECEMVESTDADGNPILDGDGNPVLEEVCTDTFIETERAKLSLINGALGGFAEGFTQSSALSVMLANVQAALSGNPDALTALRAPLVASLADNPMLTELGLTSLDVLDPDLALLEESLSSGPVQEVTTDANIASATITGRNRIGDGEAEEFAFDGNAETKWLDHNDWSGPPTEADPSWIQVEFAEPQAVSSVFITSANDAPARDPENFNLTGSFDGITYITLASFIGESFDERAETKEFRFSNGLKYPIYRLNITKNKGDDTLMQIAEIEFVGPIYTSVDHTDPVGTGVITARNRIGDGEAETFAFDNNVETKWLDHNDWSGPPTEADPSWVQVDFPAGVAVNVLGITSANDGPARDPENFVLVGSNDGGTTWVVLGEWLGESFDERFERRLFALDNILAFETYRLNITKNKGDDTLMQVAEFELIGPELPGLNHAHTAGVVITGRGRIGAGEAEEFAFDGSDQTKWLDNTAVPTDAEPSFVTVEMVGSVAVNKLALTSANDGPERDPENFNVEGSNDGTNWIRLGSWLGESFDDRFERKQYSFSNDLGFSQYRLNITKNKGDSNLMQVAEIEFIGPQFLSVDHTSANDAVYSARNRIGDGEAEEFVFDDNNETKWLDHNDWSGPPTDADPSWVQVDFTTARIVSSLSITSANDAPARDPENFNLVGSNDGGVTWTVIGSFVGESFDNRFERKLFEMGNGFAFTSYRLNITKNKGDDTLMQVAEIELIGPDI